MMQIPLSEADMAKIAEQILELSISDMPLDEPTRAARRYAEITPEQVQVAYAKWLRPGDLVQITLGPNPK
jgi:zinc protease